jgi:uncharacterized protein with ParB-like and HNH nuclease domain
MSLPHQIYDGQQRLVTISLLIAALRDKFAGNKDSSDDASIAASAVCPDKPRLERRFRISLRESDGVVLREILTNRLNQNDNISLLAKLPPKSQRVALSSPNKKILDVYEWFVRRIEDEDMNYAVDIFEKVMRDVFVIVIIPTETKVARRLVLGQSKGKDLEPIDYFKGMACFSCKDEAAQDVIMNAWNLLCDDIGKTTFESACLHLAQAYTCKPLLKNGYVFMWDLA